MLKFRIPFKVIEQARAFADQVFEARKGNPDKFLMDNEREMDRKGFEVEFAHCYAYNLPFPKLFSGKQVDEFDCILYVLVNTGIIKRMCHNKRLLVPLKFDVKTSENYLINKEQFQRKNVDAYLFESLDFVDFSTDQIYLNVHGWIEKIDVPFFSEEKKFENGSVAYKINPAHLNNPTSLYSVIREEELK